MTLPTRLLRAMVGNQAFSMVNEANIERKFLWEVEEELLLVRKSWGGGRVGSREFCISKFGLEAKVQ